MVIVDADAHVEYDVGMAQIGVYLYFLDEVGEPAFVDLALMGAEGLDGDVLSEPLTLVHLG